MTALFLYGCLIPVILVTWVSVKALERGSSPASVLVYWSAMTAVIVWLVFR